MDYLKLKAFVVNHNTRGKYKFIDNRKNYRKLCLYLIGYKEYLWQDVVPRFVKFLPDDVDVCLISSGKYIETVAQMAEKYNWSYLSTKKNNVCLIQNLAINLFPNAELIYKIDEDIFLTEGAFEKMERALLNAEKTLPYKVGMVAPLLNVNAYGYYRILEKIGKLDEYESRFGKPYMEAGQKSPIESNAEIAKFMWGQDGVVPSVDELNALFSKDGSLALCPVRLSIGCILYKRSFWESFWRFPVVFGDGMGLDETVMLGASIANSKILVVTEDTVVGHFGYGPQGKEMQAFYKNSNASFALKKNSCYDD